MASVKKPIMTIEAYGRRGLLNAQWQRKFRSPEELEAYCILHDAVIDGMRDLDPREEA